MLGRLCARRARILAGTLLLTTTVWVYDGYSAFLQANDTLNDAASGKYRVPGSAVIDTYTINDRSFLTWLFHGGHVAVTPSSPYEMRTGQKIPWWGKKKVSRQQTSSYTGPEICFVHVGKTAGSTIGCLLRFDYDCRNVTPVDTASLLPQATKHLIHNDINDCHEASPTDGVPYYSLFAVRDPLDRIKSWFTYERPTSPSRLCYARTRVLFDECNFNTLNELAERGLSSEDNGVSDVCKDRAWKAIYGSTGYCRHNYYNYKYFIQQAPSNSTWLVLRTEHLRDDWNSVEAKLWEVNKASGNPVQVSEESIPQLNKSKKKVGDKQLSDKAKTSLCAVLCREIQYYKKILKRSINLAPEQYEQSLKELSKNCPKQAKESSCPLSHPKNGKRVLFESR